MFYVFIYLMLMALCVIEIAVIGVALFIKEKRKTFFGRYVYFHLEIFDYIWNKIGTKDVVLSPVKYVKLTYEEVSTDIAKALPEKKKGEPGALSLTDDKQDASFA